MPRAEVGTTKYLNNKLKSKGLQRLRWYCQACERQMRDENGFKCHVQSEPHVRQMLLIGEDPKAHINDYSKQFQSDFLKLLRTSHGEKQVHCNHFYQQYIGDKEHLHMNATKWPSLTEFAKYLGREGICRVEDTDKGLFIAWVDNSPEALRRQDILRKKELQDKNDEEREQQQLRAQIERARVEAEAEEEVDAESKALRRTDSGKIKLNFGSKLAPKGTSVSQPDGKPQILPKINSDSTKKAHQNLLPITLTTRGAEPGSAVKVQSKDPFGESKGWVKPAPRKMTEQERIMKEEMAAMKRKDTPKQSGVETERSKRVKIY